MSEIKPTYDVSEALAILEADRKRRAESALKQIQTVLTELHCEIVAVIHVGDQEIRVPIQIVAR